MEKKMSVHTDIHTDKMAHMNTATFWAFTINNPDENDYAIVRQGYSDYVRSLIHTTEVGQDGTPHIQGWLKLQKQQRLSFVKKLFPRAHFTPLTQAEHELNTRRYVQKDDETTAGAHIQRHNDPIPDAAALLTQYCQRYKDHILEAADNLTDKTEHQAEYLDKASNDVVALRVFIRAQEKNDVSFKPAMAKLLVSPMYSKIKKEYLEEIFCYVWNKQDADDDESQQQDAGGALGEVHEQQEAEIPQAERSGDESVSDSDSESGSETSSGSDSGDEVRGGTTASPERPKHAKLIRRVFVCDNGNG